MSDSSTSNEESSEWRIVNGQRCRRGTPTPTARSAGWVAETAFVADTAFLGPKVVVLDHARVIGYAMVFDDVIVSDCAEVAGHAKVSGSWWLGGRTRVE